MYQDIRFIGKNERKKKAYRSDLKKIFSTLKPVISVTLHTGSKALMLRNSERFSVAIQTPTSLHSFSQGGQADTPKKRRNNSPILLQALCLGGVAPARSMLK